MAITKQMVCQPETSRGTKKREVGPALSLVEMELGQEGRVARLNTKDPRKVRKLMAMGIIPGIPVKIIQKFPSYVLKVGSYTWITVDRDMVGEIFVALD